jgi:hypothetical protein
MAIGLASKSQYGVECERQIAQTREAGIFFMDVRTQKFQHVIQGIA